VGQIHVGRRTQNVDRCPQKVTPFQTDIKTLSPGSSSIANRPSPSTGLASVVATTRWIGVDLEIWDIARQDRYQSISEMLCRQVYVTLVCCKISGDHHVLAAEPGMDNQKSQFISRHLAAIVLFIMIHLIQSIQPSKTDVNSSAGIPSTNSRTSSNNSSGSTRLQVTSPVFIRK
jgi:GTPase SAR1 family protein